MNGDKQPFDIPIDMLPRIPHLYLKFYPVGREKKYGWFKSLEIL